MGPFRKIANTVAAIFIASMLCFAIGCSPSNEDVLRQSVAQEFDAYKNMEDSVLQKIANTAEKDGLEELGITGKDFASAVLNGFDYNIDSIDVNEKSATVMISIASKSDSDFESRLQKAVEDFVNSQKASQMSSIEKNSEIGKIAMETFEETEVINEEVTLNFELQGNTWVSTNASDELANLDSLVFKNSK